MYVDLEATIKPHMYYWSIKWLTVLPISTLKGLLSVEVFLTNFAQYVQVFNESPFPELVPLGHFSTRYQPTTLLGYTRLEPLQ